MKWFLIAALTLAGLMVVLGLLFPSKVLELAIEQESLGAIRQCLKLGLDPNRSTYGNTPFLHAIALKNEQVVELLLAEGARADQRPQGLFGEWPLDVAAHGASGGVIVKLLAHGATPMAEGSEAFSIAVRDRSPEIVALLMPKMLAAPVAERQPRLAAAMKQLIEFRGSTDPAFADLFDQIVGAGFDAAADSTLLPLAIERNQPSIADRLLRAGANSNAQSNGQPVLNLAISRGEGSLARAILEAGADFNAASASGWTALHAAARSDDVGLVELLLARGAELHALTKLGFTATDLAGTEPMRAFLISRGGTLTVAHAEYVPEVRTKEIVCPVTGSSGRCSSCKGSGRMGQRKCDSCGGSGRCSRCNGSGYVRVDDR